MSIADYSFEDRLDRASTLPSSWYTDVEVLELEKLRVFGCAWQLVGRAEQVAGPGDFFTASIADEPICRTQLEIYGSEATEVGWRKVG